MHPHTEGSQPEKQKARLLLTPHDLDEALSDVEASLLLVDLALQELFDRPTAWESCGLPRRDGADLYILPTVDRHALGRAVDHAVDLHAEAAAALRVGVPSDLAHSVPCGRVDPAARPPGGLDADRHAHPADATRRP